MLSDRCLSVLSVTLVYCDQTAGWIKMPLGMAIDLGPGDIVLGGDPAPPNKGAHHPPILAHVLSPNGCMDQDAAWYGRRSRPRPHCVVWEPSSLSKQRHSSPQFSAHICCGQTAGWIKMPLGRVVDIGPGDIVLDVAQLYPFGKGHSSQPLFSVHVFCGQTVTHLRYC